MTMTEVCVASCIGVLLMVTALAGLGTARSVGTHTSQHTSALALCQDTVEAMRADDFDHLTPQNYPDEYLTLTHTNAPQETLIPCHRVVEIEDASSPGLGAKRINIAVEWTYRGREQDLRVETIIYDYH